MPMIKDPTFNVYAKGGNVENRKNTPKKDELLKLAKDVKDIEFDLENEIVDILKQEYDKEKVEGQSFLDWLGTKDRDYFSLAVDEFTFSQETDDRIGFKCFT